MDFSKWLNNEFIPNNPDKKLIKEVSSKAVKQSIMNAEKAFERFFKGQSKFPIFKKKNINKIKEVKKLEKKLKREQRCLSRKYEGLKKRNKNNKKGEATRQNIQKQVLKVQKLHQKLTNIRTNYINKTISEIIKQKTSFIAIEDLNVSGMMKNKHLSKAIA